MRTLAFLLLATQATAEPRLFPAPEPATGTVTLYSTLDERLAVPLVAAFQTLHPTTTVAYEDLLAGDIATRIRDETANGTPTADPGCTITT